MSQRWGFTPSRRFWRLAALALGIIVCGGLFAALLLWGSQPQGDKYVRLLVGPSEETGNYSLMLPFLSDESGVNVVIEANDIEFYGDSDDYWQCESAAGSGARYSAAEFAIRAEEPVLVVARAERPSGGHLSIYAGAAPESNEFGPTHLLLYDFWPNVNSGPVLEVGLPDLAKARIYLLGEEGGTAEVGQPECSRLVLHGRRCTLNTHDEESFSGSFYAAVAILQEGRGSVQIGDEPIAISPTSLLKLCGDFLVRLENDTTRIEGWADSVTLNRDEQLPPRWGFATEFAQDLALVLVSALIGVFLGYLFGGREREKRAPPA